MKPHRVLSRSLCSFATVCALANLTAAPAQADTTLAAAFAACEVSVMQKSDAPLRAIGEVQEELTYGSQLRIETPQGNLIAIFSSRSKSITVCSFLGKHPELRNLFQDQWQDWVEWDEAADISHSWYAEALAVPGSAPVTDHAHGGFIVGRCGDQEQGLFLGYRNAASDIIQERLPELMPFQDPIYHYQFFVTTVDRESCEMVVEMSRPAE